MNKHLTVLILLFSLVSCATYEAKYLNEDLAEDLDPEREVEHTFYLIGDAGLSPMGGMNPVLKRVKDRLRTAEDNSTALFLGDNIYPAGFPAPNKDPQAYKEAKNHIDAQLATVEDFKGRTIFIPGNHDWYAGGLKGLKRQEKYIEDALDKKNVFLPENGCPLEVEKISADVVLIIIDTEWYLTNWDKTPSINDDCELKDRQKFWGELESTIKKNADKTVIIATHHPVFSYGEHGGHFTLKQQVFPGKKIFLPVLGSLANLLRNTGGVSVEDLNNKRYREMRYRLVTLAHFAERVVFTSGHEHTLQYIVERDVPQIVSGAGAKKGATRLQGGSQFSTGRRGYAELTIYKDGGSDVLFYGVSDQGEEERLFAKKVTDPVSEQLLQQFPITSSETFKTSIYREEEVSRSGFFKLLWGERYREYYGTEVEVPVAYLDTLEGGLIPVRKGGGQQSKSLRLQTKDGSKQFVLRAMRKQAEQMLQATAFTQRYIIGEFQDSFAEDLLEDFYTGAHPYAPFALNALSEAAEVYHTNPRLFYVPKQTALGKYNTTFGDELYMFEEHVSEGHQSAGFGYTEEIESTHDFLIKLRKDEKYTLDTPRYIRSRLFDMLLGDWDRHQDQWRWARFENDSTDQIMYSPIPRDRDQVYSIMGDGLIMALATRIVPALKKMEGFDSEIRNIRTFNTNPYSLDMALLNQTEAADWIRQAEFLQQQLTDEVIEKSFLEFPKEVRDETLEEIKAKIIARRSALKDIALSYYRILHKYVILKGTDKDDWFEIFTDPNGNLVVNAYRNIEGEKQKRFISKVYNPEITKEVWIYGLDDKDRFEVNTGVKNRIKVRIVGGNGSDRYQVQAGKKVKIYDFASKKNTFDLIDKVKVRLSDDYDLNTYRPLKLVDYHNQFVPTIGFNPDDGMRIGFSNNFTRYGFRRNPFSSQHQLSGAYYFATSGFDIQYSAEFAHLFEHWNFRLETRFTSPNFSENFFGFGNNTTNQDADLGLDYNRVRLQQIYIKPTLVWRGQLGGTFSLGASYERITVEETSDRFVNTFYQLNGEENSLGFLGAEAHYLFENQDNLAFPTLGMRSELQVGFKVNTTESNRHFGYVIPTLSLDHRLIPSGKLVLASKWKGIFNIGNGFEFYQGAQIGALDGLRGFRNERFTGKTAYYQLTDLRFELNEMRTGLVPISIGFYAGFDYGRVWFPGLSSNRWHTSYGGGFFVNGTDLLSARIALFASEDGPRFSFGVGFGF